MAPVLQLLQRLGAETPDGELVRRFVQWGEEQAFAQIVQRHGRMVLGVCQRILHQSQDAEDAFQAVFILLAQKAPKLKQPERLSAWLHGVALRVARKALALRQRRATQESPLRVEPTREASDEESLSELLLVLDEHLHHLPERYRLPLILHYLGGLTQAETAARLGCPTGTVAARLSRGRELLRRRLAQRFATLSSATVLAALAQSGTTSAGVFLVTLSQQITQPITKPAVLSLVHGVTMTLLYERMQYAFLSVALFLACLAGPGWLLYHAQAGDPALTRAPTPPPLPEPPTTITTKNFRVTAPTPRLAQLIADAAEKERAALARRWLGRLLPDWRTPCLIIVRDEPKSNKSTTFQFEGGKVLTREMVLTGSLEQILASLLPHEIMHTILADHYGRPVPRWADEGIAQLAEDSTSQNQQRAAVRRLVARNELPTDLRAFLNTRDYPSRNLTEFHTQSHGLCDFLLARKDEATLLNFVLHGMAEGWDLAARHKYGFTDLSALEKEWHQWLARDVRLPEKTTLELEKLLPRSQPHAGLASLSADGMRVRIRVMAEEAQPQYGYLLYGAGQNLSRLLRMSGTMEIPFASVKIQAAGGKQLTAEEIRRRLKSDTVLLIHTDSAPLPAAFLALLRPETLILGVLPTPASAPIRVPGQDPRDSTTPIFPAVRPGAALPPVEPPSEAEILRLMNPKIALGSEVKIVTDKIVDRLESTRFFPLVGRAQLRHIQFKCVVYWVDENQQSSSRVLYLDRDQLHLAPESK